MKHHPAERSRSRKGPAVAALVLGVWLAVGLAACAPGGAQNAGPTNGPETHAVAAKGLRADDPVPMCGGRASYLFIARDFRCPGGGNPLDGTPRAGARARIGSIGAGPDGHIVDMYEVPCPRGPVRVFVDMYHCPDGGSPFGP